MFDSVTLLQCAGVGEAIAREAMWGYFKRKQAASTDDDKPTNGGIIGSFVQDKNIYFVSQLSDRWLNI